MQPTVRKNSIEARLLALTLGMLSLLLLITIATTLFGLSQFEQRVSATRLAEEHSLIAQSMRNQQTSLMSTALTLASDPGLIEAVRTGDRTLSQQILVPLQVRHQLDQVKLAGPSGQTLLQSGPASAETQTAMRRALLTIEQSAIVLAPEGAFLTAAVPIRDDDGVQGALVISQQLDDTAVSMLNFQRADPIVTLHRADGSPLASSAATLDFADHDAAFWQRALGGVQIESHRFADGASYRVLFTALDPDEASGLFYSIALTSGPIQAFRFAIIFQNVLILAVAALLSGLVLVTVIRSFIVRPLNDLAGAAARIGAGELDLNLASERADEIGRLTNSFGTMTGRLRESFAALDSRNSALEQERTQIEQARSRLQAEVAEAQRTILQMAMPLIPLDRQTLVLPLVGALDAARADQLLATLLEGVEQQRARVAIIDITGVPVVDTPVAQSLLNALQAVRLLGAQVIVTGIQPEVAQSLVGLGLDLEALQTYGTLEQAISAVRKPGAAR
jgi:anti-anti-sigma regulatory factor/HAMP domain-containing protein